MEDVGIVVLLISPAEGKIKFCNLATLDGKVTCLKRDFRFPVLVSIFSRVYHGTWHVASVTLISLDLCWIPGKQKKGPGNIELLQRRTNKVVLP